MVEWWAGLDFFEKIFWYISIPFSVLFLIQMIITFAGMGDNDMDVDSSDDVDGNDNSGDGSVFRVFTIRNFIIFLSVFGWSGITFYNAGVNQLLTILISVVIGVVVMLLVALLFYSITRLVQNGTMNIKYAKGHSAEVYIPIPSNKSGVGKVNITLQGALREIDAMTEGKSIPRGTIVKVVGVVNDSILMVEK